MPAIGGFNGEGEKDAPLVSPTATLEGGNRGGSGGAATPRASRSSIGSQWPLSRWLGPSILTTGTSMCLVPGGGARLCRSPVPPRVPVFRSLLLGPTSASRLPKHEWNASSGGRCTRETTRTALEWNGSGPALTRALYLEDFYEIRRMEDWRPQISNEAGQCSWKIKDLCLR
ncbi:hypothetical protein KM043_008698 [Ampulex compressa]|nr:hypothetical protein KM043_008698 [Ampulex compressa]